MVNIKVFEYEVGHVFNVKYLEAEGKILAINKDGIAAVTLDYPVEGELNAVVFTTKIKSWSVWNYVEKIAGRKKFKKN